MPDLRATNSRTTIESIRGIFQQLPINAKIFIHIALVKLIIDGKAHFPKAIAKRPERAEIL